MAGHIAIVGGGSGMGFATAKAARKAGMDVSIMGRSEDKLAKAAQALGGGVGTAVMDMTDEGSVSRAFANFDDAALTALVITASSVAHGPFAEAKTSDIRAMIEAKFLGAYVTAREALPKMADGGSITFVSGVLSRRPGTNGAGLAAVNAALEALGRALALELGPRLRVNTLSPGMTRTEAYDEMPQARRDAMYASVAEKLPVGRVAAPEEIAEAILLLVQNGFITGTTLDIDGGHIIS